MKRIKKLCVIFIITCVLLSTFLITCCAYSEVYPDYLELGNSAFIECETSIGYGTLVLPLSARENSVTYKNQTFQNCSSSTINGYFITEDGVKTSVRGQALNNFQYSYREGYQSIYTDLIFSDIYNTNIKFSLSTEDEENKAVHFSEFEQVLIVLLCCLLIIVPLIFLAFMLFGR